LIRIQLNKESWAKAIVIYATETRRHRENRIIYSVPLRLKFYVCLFKVSFQESFKGSSMPSFILAHLMNGVMNGVVI
jgi:hypothetical protein